MFKKLFSATLILLFAFTTSTFASPKKLMQNPLENNLQEEIKANSQAYRVYSSTSYSSYIFTPSDKDFYKIYVNNGKYMDINLTNVPGDYNLYLYNQSGTLVAYSENGYGSSERIVYKAKYTGYYYILVIGYNGSYSNTQKYTLTPYIY